MRTWHVTTILLLLLVLLMAGCTGPFYDKSEANEEKLLVQNSIQELFSAYNAKDLEAIKKYTAEKCSYFWEDGTGISEPTIEEQGLISILRDRAEGSYTGTFRVKDFDISIYEDSAFAEGYVYGMISTDTTVIAKGPWRTTTSWVRQEDTWKLTHIHFSRGVSMEYSLHIPDEYGKEPEKKWPVLLYLHGIEERGLDMDKVNMNGLPKLIAEYGKQEKEFPFITISPQCPSSKTWSDVPDQLINIIDTVSQKYKVDQSRILISGLDIGGVGAYYAALAYPERFAAIVPVSGAVRNSDLESVRHIKHIPVKAYHYEKDEVVLAADGQATIDKLKEAGNENAEFYTLSVTGNAAISQIFDKAEFIEWLLRQKKSIK